MTEKCKWNEFFNEMSPDYDCTSYETECERIYIDCLGICFKFCPYCGKEIEEVKENG